MSQGSYVTGTEHRTTTTSTERWVPSERRSAAYVGTEGYAGGVYAVVCGVDGAKGLLCLRTPDYTPLGWVLASEFVEAV
jgi:hypothetical protein